MSRLAQHADSVVAYEVQERNRQMLAEQEAQEAAAQEQERAMAEQQAIAKKQQAQAEKQRLATAEKAKKDEQNRQLEVVDTHNDGLDASRRAVTNVDREYSRRSREAGIAASNAYEDAAQAKREGAPDAKKKAEESKLARQVARDREMERLEWERHREEMDRKLDEEDLKVSRAKKEIRAGGGKSWLEAITGDTKDPNARPEQKTAEKVMPNMPLSPDEKEKVSQAKLMERRQQAKQQSEALIGAPDEEVERRAQDAVATLGKRSEELAKREQEIVTPITTMESRLDEIHARNKSSAPPTDGRVMVTDNQGNQWHPDLWKEYELALNGYQTLASNSQEALKKLREDVDQFEIDREVGEGAIAIYNHRQQKSHEAQKATIMEQRKAAVEELRAPEYGTASADLEALDAEYDQAVEQLMPTLQTGSEEAKSALDYLSQKYTQDRQAIITAASENRGRVWESLTAERKRTMAELDDYKLPEESPDYDPEMAMQFMSPDERKAAAEESLRNLERLAQRRKDGMAESTPAAIAKIAKENNIPETKALELYKDVIKSTEAWPESVRDPKKQARVLSDSRIVVNPRVWVNPDQYEAAVNASDASDKAKEAALAILPELRKRAAQDLVQALSADPELKEKLDGLPGKTDEEKALAFQQEMQGHGAFEAGVNAASARYKSGKAGVAESALGVLAALTGAVKDKTGVSLGAKYLEDSMRAWSKKAQAYERAAQETQAGVIGTGLSKLAGAVPSTAPSVAVGYLTGGLGNALGASAQTVRALQMAGASGGAGFQAGGSMYSNALDAYTEQGMPPEQARREALIPALLSAVSTAAITRGFGATGIESLFRSAEGREIVKRTLGNFLASAGKGGLSEGVEELTNELTDSAIEIATFNTELSARQVLERAVEAGSLGAVLGGGFDAAKTGSEYRQQSKLDGLAGEALLAASDQEIDTYQPAPGMDPQGAVQAIATARLVRDIAQGADLGDLTDQQLALVGIKRDAKGELKNAGSDPLVKLENGNPIIRQEVIDQITARLPLTGRAIGMSEQEAREFFAQSGNVPQLPASEPASGAGNSMPTTTAQNPPQNTAQNTNVPRTPAVTATNAVQSAPVPVEAAVTTPPSGPAPTGEVWSYTGESGNVVTVPRQGINSVADAAKAIQQALPQGETVDRSRIVAPHQQPKALASRVISDTMQPETIKARANQIGDALKAKGKTGQGAAIKLAGNFLAKYANRYGAAFSGIRYEDGRHKGSGGVLYDGRTGELVVDTEALGQTVARSGNREAAIRSRVHEEAMHHVIGQRVGRQKTAELWRMLPESLKRASMGSYEASVLQQAADAKGGELTDAEVADALARVSDEMKRRYGDEDEDATRGEEFLRQLLQKEFFNEVTEVASEYPGLAGFIKQLLDDLVKALGDLASYIQNPAARKEIEAARDAAAELARELGLVESKPTAPKVTETKAAVSTESDKSTIEESVTIKTDVDEAAHDAATSPLNGLLEPTEAQKREGNYQHGHTEINGLKISIENPEGSTRSGMDASGNPWSVQMQSHYGYVLGTEGADGDHVDVFIKPGTPEDYHGKVYVIDQVNPDGSFDEHKAVIGAKSAREASDLYNANYSAGWEGLGGIKAMSWDDFKAWAKGTKEAAAAEKSPESAPDPTIRKSLIVEPDAANSAPQVIATVGTATPNGARATVEWDVMEARDLADSIESEVNENQTRQRKGDRVSDEQRLKIASNPDPNLLGESATGMNGAPIMDGGKVIAGNGRMGGILYGYSTSDQGMGRKFTSVYKPFVLQEAGRFGLAEKAQGMDQPVLVRKVAAYTQGTKQEFIDQNNPKDGGLLRESKTDEGLNDARALGPKLMEDMTFRADGGLTADSVVGASMALEKANRAPHRDRDGNPDVRELTRRVQQAYLAQMAQRAGRSIDDVVALLDSDHGKRLMAGVLRAAPELAGFDADLSLNNALIDTLISYQRGLESVKSGKMASIAEWAKNRRGELLADGTPESNALLDVFVDGDAKPAAMRDFFEQYVRAAGEENYRRKEAGQSDDMFGEPRQPVPVVRIIERARQGDALLRGSPAAPFRVTPELDAAYLDAVERGYTDSAQAMVDQVAKARGYDTKGFHGTAQRFSTFRNGSEGAIFFSENEKVAKGFADWQVDGGEGSEPIVVNAWLNLGNTKHLTREDVMDRTSRGTFEHSYKKMSQVMHDARDDGYDSVTISGTHEMAQSGKQFGVFSPSQIKSADAVVRDDAGNVIPLSWRFNPDMADLRYSSAAPERDSDPEHDIDEEEIAALMAELESDMPSANELEWLTAMAMGENPGERSIGNPEVASLGDDPETRQRLDAVRLSYDLNRDQETREQWAESARKMLADDPNGVKLQLLEAAAEGRALDSPEMVMASKILIPELTRQAWLTGNKALEREAQMLAYAYAKAGTEQARALSARFDPHKTPGERRKEYLAKLLYTPDPKVRADIEKAPTPAEKRRRIASLEKQIRTARNQGDKKQAASLDRELRAQRATPDQMETLETENAKRLRDIERALKNEGLSVDDLFEGRATVRLKLGKIVAETLGESDERRTKAIDLILHGWPDTEIARATGFSRQQVEEISRSLTPQVVEDLLVDLFQRGYTVEDIGIANLASRMASSPSAVPATESARLDVLKAELRKQYDPRMGSDAIDDEVRFADKTLKRLAKSDVPFSKALQSVKLIVHAGGTDQPLVWLRLKKPPRTGGQWMANASRARTEIDPTDYLQELDAKAASLMGDPIASSPAAVQGLAGREGAKMTPEQARELARKVTKLLVPTSRQRNSGKWKKVKRKDAPATAANPRPQPAPRDVPFVPDIPRTKQDVMIYGMEALNPEEQQNINRPRQPGDEPVSSEPGVQQRLGIPRTGPVPTERPVSTDSGRQQKLDITTGPAAPARQGFDPGTGDQRGRQGKLDVKTGPDAPDKPLPSSKEMRSQQGKQQKLALDPDVDEFVPFDPEDPVQSYRIQRVIDTSGSDYLDKGIEYWVNGLLSGPQTQIVNISGNTASAIWDMTAQRGMELMANSLVRDPNSAQWGEMKHLIRGLAPGIMKGFSMARQAFDAEADVTSDAFLDQQAVFGEGGFDKAQRIKAAIGGKPGRVVRIPGRLLMAMDSFFKTAIGSMEVGAQAYRIGKAMGHAGVELENFIAREIATPGSASWIRAMEKARELTFTQDIKTKEQGGHAVDNAAATFSQLVNSNRLSRFIFPFIRTPYNIFKMGLRKTPLGSIPMLSHAARATMMRKPGETFRQAWERGNSGLMVKELAEQTIAWLLLAGLWQLAEGGDDENEGWTITGGRPGGRETSGERDLQSRLQGGSYQVMHNGKPVFGYGRIEPAATIVGSMVDAIRMIKSSRTPASKLGALLGSTASQIQQKTFTQGFAGLADTTAALVGLGKDAAAETAVENARDWLIEGLVPNLVRQTARNIDDTVRNRKASTPGHSALPSGSFAEPLVDPYGREMKKDGNAASRLIYPQPLKTDPHPGDVMLDRFAKQNPDEAYHPLRSTMANYRYEVDKERKEFTDPEKTAYDKIRGLAFDQLLRDYFQAERQNPTTPRDPVKAPTAEDVEEYKKLRSKAGREAKAVVREGGWKERLAELEAAQKSVK